MKKQIDPYLSFAPLATSQTRRQLLLSGLALTLLKPAIPAVCYAASTVNPRQKRPAVKSW